MPRRSALFALWALLTISAAAAVLPWEPGSWTVREAEAQWLYAAEVRIAAQQLESGSTEFALQERQRVGWGELLLPSPRFLPPDSAADAWRHSGVLQLENGVDVRIAARRLATDQIEFALQIRLGGQWSERLRPVNRLFPSRPAFETWLYSSSVRAPQPTHVPYAYVNGCQVGQSVECRTWVDSLGRVTTSLRTTSIQSGGQGVRLDITCYSGNDLRVELRGLPIAELGIVTPVQMRLDTGVLDVTDWYVSPGRDGPISSVRSQWTARHIDFLYDGQAVEIELPGSELPHYKFDINGLFSSPIQDNIVHCGNYDAEAARPPPPQHSASGSRRIPGDEAFTNGWWRDAGPRSLNEVGLWQGAPLRWDRRTDDSESPSMWLDVVCGPEGLSGGVSVTSLVESRLTSERSSAVSQLRVQWSVDGGEAHDEVWLDSWAGYRPNNFREFLEVVRGGNMLDLAMGSNLQLSGHLMLDAMFSTPVQDLLEHCLAHPASPDVPRSGNFWVSEAGISYYLGSFIFGRWDGWVELKVDSLGVHREGTGEPALVLSCGIEGVGVVIYGLERDLPFDTSGTSVQVTWTTDHTTMTETWDLWTTRHSQLGRAISPRDDDNFYAEIRGTDLLIVSNAADLRMTDQVDFAGLGVWELPVIGGLDDCADAPREH